MVKMRTYTEKELLKAIEYACGYQKASDYQTAGKLLIVDKSDLQQNIETLLNELASTNENVHKEIELRDIFI
jgi:isocitrate/isopropylmalate dehydrogenase